MENPMLVGGVLAMVSGALIVVGALLGAAILYISECRAEAGRTH